MRVQCVRPEHNEHNCLYDHIMSSVSGYKQSSKEGCQPSCLRAASPQRYQQPSSAVLPWELLEPFLCTSAGLTKLCDLLPWEIHLAMSSSASLQQAAVPDFWVEYAWVFLMACTISKRCKSISETIFLPYFSYCFLLCPVHKNRLDVGCACHSLVCSG